MAQISFEIAKKDYVDNSISAVEAKIPVITAGTEDLEEGATLGHGEIYLVLEEK